MRRDSSARAPILPAQRGLQRLSAATASRSTGPCETSSQSQRRPYCAHAIDDRQQVDPLLGQRVLDARRDLGVGVALDDPVLLERPQAKRQRAGADPRERALELAEAAAPGGEVTHEQQRPLAADQLGRVDDGTRVSNGMPSLYQLKSPPNRRRRGRLRNGCDAALRGALAGPRRVRASTDERDRACGDAACDGRQPRAGGVAGPGPGGVAGRRRARARRPSSCRGVPARRAAA